MPATSLLNLPSENIIEICRGVIRSDPHRDLAGLLGTCARLNKIARPLAYREVALRQPRPREGDDGLFPDEPLFAFERYGSLLTAQPKIGRFLRTLSFTAFSTDPVPTAAWCSAASEAAVLEFCLKADQLEELRIHGCHWEDSDAGIPPANLRKLTSLSITDAVLDGSDPIFTRIARHFPSLRIFTFSSAPALLNDITINSAIRQDLLTAHTIIYAPSYPVMPDLVEAVLEASAPTAREFVIYLPLVAEPPYFLVPDEFFFPDGLLLSDITIVLPLHSFPINADITDTWHYLGLIVSSAPATMRRLRFVFDTGRRSPGRIARHFGALPDYYMTALLDELDSSVEVTLELRSAEGADRPYWAPVCERFPGWSDIIRREKVDIDSSVSPAGTPVFRKITAASAPAYLDEITFLAWYAGQILGQGPVEVSTFAAASSRRIRVC